MVAAISIPIAETAAVAITETESAIVTLTVAIDLAHHRGWTFLVLVHTHGDVAQHVLAEPFLALDLVESSGGCVDVEKGEMRLAGLAQTVGEGLHAPLLGLDDLASHLLENARELGGQVFDLLRARILARQEDVFVEGHRYAFPCVMLLPAQSPSSPFGKGSNAQKAGTRDAGPSGPAAQVSHQSGRPFSSRPGSSGSAGYKIFRPKGKPQTAPANAGPGSA